MVPGEDLPGGGGGGLAVPIPKALPTGLLPPYLKGDPTKRENCSPYGATLAELVERFATSKHRLRILEGFLGFRAALRRAGLADGFQWVDGSLVDAQVLEPNDLDVVTFCSLPDSVAPADEQLFDKQVVRRRFLCDAYFVDLAPDRLVGVTADTAYWCGLFSHQRRSLHWKGLLQIDLMTPDIDAAASERLRALKGAA